MPSASTNPSPKKTLSPAQKAAQLTWQLKGHLKNAQIAYLRVAVLLARVRDEKLYADLHCRNMETYAAERLSLSKTSLYRYLQIHDWVKAFHPEWLESKPKGFIPDLSDIADLIWIEKELAKKRLSASRKATLVEMKRKALAGDLLAKELKAFRRSSRRNSDDGIKAFLASLRALRKRGANLAAMPAEVTDHLDAAIKVLENHRVLATAGLEVLGGLA